MISVCIDPEVLQTYEHLQVGDYTITRYKDGDYWIARGNGEGMQVSKQAFEQLIDTFFKEGLSHG